MVSHAKDLLQILEGLHRYPEDPEQKSAIRKKTETLLNEAEKLRKQFFGNRVQLHVINNIRNGNCNEDCGYCAQRKKSSKTGTPVARGTGAGGIPEKKASDTIFRYKQKDMQEILAEAKMAVRSGAFRYCLVSAGKGPTRRDIDFYCEVIQEIKRRFPIQVCLSAGLLEDEKQAARLKEAGLDRYNHNLNSSARNYSKFCTTHTYQDRLKTLRSVSRAGISLCSGVIIGLGETNAEILDMAKKCAQLEIPSIPVNFFLPVPNHTIKNSPFEHAPSKNLENQSDQHDHVMFCLAVLAIFRLLNPKAEIRLAAGREYYLQGIHQIRALRIVNSIFVEGYLNVQGQSAQSTIDMLKQAGFEIELNDADYLQRAHEKRKQKTSAPKPPAKVGELKLKESHQLRPACIDR